MVSSSFLNSLILFGPSKISDGLMYYMLQIVQDKYKITIDPGLEGRNPLVELCKNSYWIRPSDLPRMYSDIMQPGSQGGFVY